MGLFHTYFPPVTDDDGKVSLRLTIHHAIYFVLLVLLFASQPVSNFMMSGMEILMAVNWALEWDMRRKFSRRTSPLLPLLLAFAILMAVHLLWMLGSTNVGYGWYDIFKKLPLIAIPLVVLTSRQLNFKQLTFIVMGFVISVFVAAIIGNIRMATEPDIPYRDVPFISHIRYSLNVCLAIVFILWYAVRRYSRITFPLKFRDYLAYILIASLTLFLLDFLLKLRSYTAFIVLFVVAIALLLCYWRRINSAKIRILLVSLLVVIVAVLAVVTLKMRNDYYSPVALIEQPLAEKTVNGNSYRHTNDGFIENGNYVNNYVCEEELRAEWVKRSAMAIDSSTANGYAVMPTLIRYLNGLGTTKDSVGMTLLTDGDVKAIENGIANPVYVYGSSLRKMYYVMFFEYESHKRYGSVKDFTMLQRLELWRNALRVFKSHPLFGVGTGDVVDECHAQLEADGSQLRGTTKHAHNQYLTFLVSFGIVGFLLIAVAFVWALRKIRLFHQPVAAAYICILLMSFITEDTVETLAGCLFAVLPFCLLGVISKIDGCPNNIDC
ncbi:MAG: O-antigen ligase family protein [Bacteroidales bacterium]|nr:O-antigen ligase family protein [Bacteroidales bacterium]